MSKMFARKSIFCVIAAAAGVTAVAVMYSCGSRSMHLFIASSINLWLYVIHSAKFIAGKNEHIPALWIQMRLIEWAYFELSNVG